jgi:hypothetical protein
VEFGGEDLVFGRHASVLPGMQEVNSCACATPKYWLPSSWHLPIGPSENRDHDQPRQGNAKCNYLIIKLSFGCHDVPPPILSRGLGHGCPEPGPPS